MLQVNEKALGAEHPPTLIRVNNLAGLYRAQGHYDEAAPLYKRTVQGFKNALPANHPYIEIALDNYAYLLKKIDRNAEATELEKQAEAIRSAHDSEK